MDRDRRRRVRPDGGARRRGGRGGVRVRRRQPARRAPSPPRLGAVGRMTEGSGNRAAIAAASAVPAATMVHVGHGELMPALKDLAASLGATDRHLFLGYQEAALPALSRAWDTFVFPASGSEQGQ